MWGKWSAGSLVLGNEEIRTPPNADLQSAWVDPDESNVIALYRDYREQNQFIVRIYNQAAELKHSFPLRRNRDVGLPLIRVFRSGWSLCLFPEDQSYRWISPTGGAITGSVFPNTQFDLEKKILTAVNSQGDFFSLQMKSSDVRVKKNIVLMRWQEGARPDSLLTLPLNIPYYFQIHNQLAWVIGTASMLDNGPPDFIETRIDLTTLQIVSYRQLRGIPRKSILTTDKAFLIYDDGIIMESVGDVTKTSEFFPFQDQTYVRDVFSDGRFLWILATPDPHVDKTGITFPDFVIIRFQQANHLMTAHALDLPPANRVSASLSTDKTVLLIAHNSVVSQFRLPINP
ncbi:MAG: hypothetical protein GXO90_05130 [FCB group bacterium]|nr:hypothetical protein [FCB group bacterium]